MPYKIIISYMNQYLSLVADSSYPFLNCESQRLAQTLLCCSVGKSSMVNILETLEKPFKQNLAALFWMAFWESDRPQLCYQLVTSLLSQYTKKNHCKSYHKVTRHKKNGLMCTKYTCLYFVGYLPFSITIKLATQFYKILYVFVPR